MGTLEAIKDEDTACTPSKAPSSGGVHVHVMSRRDRMCMRDSHARAQSGCTHRACDGQRERESARAKQRERERERERERRERERERE